MASERWRKREAVAYVDGPTTAIVNLDQLGEPPLLLSDSGAAIWEAIDGERTAAEIVDLMGVTYGVTSHNVERDVEVFFTHLLTHFLIEPAGAASL